MARSKSPARGRKKSAAKAAAACGGMNLDDDNVRLAITVGVSVAYLVAVKGAPINKDLIGDFFQLGAGEHTVPQ